MKICTINVPESFIEEMEELVGEDGLYPSRSELIRCAVREFLLKKLSITRQLLEQDESDFEDFDKENYVRIPIAEAEAEDGESLFKTYKILRRLA